jgi:RNA polymerase sigma factor (sigma-70 family)
MASETTHPSLLSRLHDPSDEEAWRAFEARYRELIRRYCKRRGLQTADAEDVGQVVLLALSRSMRNFRFDPTRGRFRDYLGRVVQNAIQRHLSRPSLEVRVLDTSVLDALNMLDARGDPLEPTWQSEWAQHHVRLAMRAVRKSVKAESLAVFECLLAGATVADAAQTFGTTAAAVNKIKQRIGERLREEIGKQVRDEEFPTA